MAYVVCCTAPARVVNPLSSMMQTRSAAKKTTSKDATEDAYVDHSASDHAHGLSQGKKRRRQVADKMVPKKRRRRKPGKMCQLNLDVLFVIAGSVHPIDLLGLARTCKSLWRLLMHESSGFVWKASRRQVEDLPDCPADLTEAQYANLMFYARCHGCGKSAKTIFCEVRRRYCHECRVERFCPLFQSHSIARKHDVLGIEGVVIEGETIRCFDREQMRSFLREYERSSDKQQLIKDKEEQCVALRRHARLCEEWQRERDPVYQRSIHMKVRRQERERSIFERLRQLGFGRELSLFGQREIKKSCPALFEKSKPLMDEEWDRAWPELIQELNRLHAHRINELFAQWDAHYLFHYMQDYM